MPVEPEGAGMTCVTDTWSRNQRMCQSARRPRGSGNIPTLWLSEFEYLKGVQPNLTEANYAASARTQEADTGSKRREHGKQQQLPETAKTAMPWARLTLFPKLIRCLGRHVGMPSMVDSRRASPRARTAEDREDEVPPPPPLLMKSPTRNPQRPQAGAAPEPFRPRRTQKLLCLRRTQNPR
eukprot:16436085-Heterocapsa_arctica.AAC.1